MEVQMREDIKKSLFAGVLIGLGVVTSLTLDNKYVSAALFSLGLQVIIQCGLKLYTGRIGFVKGITDFLGLLPVLLANLIGCGAVVMAAFYTNEEIYEKAVTIAKTRESYSMGKLFILGIMCGILMLVAVYAKNQIITIFCIMVFILCNYQHCIAAFPYLLVNPSLIHTVKFLCIIAGNSAGSILAYYLIKEADVSVG
jgi:formate/nitrite transporter FocA (FNT family)